MWIPPVSPNGVRVLQLDRMVEIVGPHHAEHRTEALGEVEPRTGPHAETARRASTGGSPSSVAAARPATSRPASSVVRARRSGPAGGADQRTHHRRRSVAGPTRGSAPRRAAGVRNAGSSYNVASTMARLAAEHFCPAWPNAERTRSAIAWSRSADGGDDHGVLAARLGEQPHVGLPVEEQPGRLVRARQDDRVDVGMGDEPAADARRRAAHELQHVARARRRASTARRATRRCARASGAGLRMTALPAASAASTPPAGIAYGKFHGDDHDDRRARDAEPGCLGGVERRASARSA